MVKQSFKYVFVPAELSEPLQELQESYQDDDSAVTCLLDKLKGHYKQVRPPPTGAQIQQHRDSLMKHVPEGTQLPESLLSAASELNLVENTALMTNNSHSDYIGVNLYTDDNAGMYNAPSNHRASEFAFCCGKRLEVRGDAFLARIFDNDDAFKRLDFTLKDMTSSAAWVKEAKRQNDKKPSSEAFVKQMQRHQLAPQLQQQQKSSPSPSPAEQAKQAGNAAFARQDFRQAVTEYSTALRHDPQHPAALNNRAMAYLKLDEPQRAAADCDTLLLHQPDNVKALLRRATAREKLGDAALSIHDFEHVLKLQPQNKEAMAGQQRLSNVP
ncbi:hypothetical protein WJX74_006236 [Apatococcus lobatus]|uniref:Uncharacterized protein n=1 Tax=Apatococcus lobatus TaxID=904363 RepID=A0AAW1S6E8_9CHLO